MNEFSRNEPYVFGQDVLADRRVIERALGYSLDRIAEDLLRSGAGLDPNLDAIISDIIATLKMKHPRSSISPSYISLMIRDIYAKLYLKSLQPNALEAANAALEEAIIEVVWEKSSIEEIIAYIISIKNKIVQMRGMDMYKKIIYFLRMAVSMKKKFGSADGIIDSIPEYLDLKFKVISLEENGGDGV